MDIKTIVGLIDNTAHVFSACREQGDFAAYQRHRDSLVKNILLLVEEEKAKETKKLEDKYNYVKISEMY